MANARARDVRGAATTETSAQFPPGVDLEVPVSRRTSTSARKRSPAWITVGGVLSCCVFVHATAYAMEQRCSELGDNCVCSEPLNGTLTRVGSSYYNPDDSTSKECTVDNFSDPMFVGAAITRNIDDLAPTNEVDIL